MKLSTCLALLVLLTVPLIGCSGGDGSAPVADSNDIAEYVASNPDSNAATEPEGGDP